MDNNLLTAFIALTAFAVVIQAGILVGLYLSVRKSSARMEALATEFREKVLPTVITAQSMLAELRPKIEAVATNFQESTAIMRAQLGPMDATFSDLLARAPLQAILPHQLLHPPIDPLHD